MRYVIMSSIIRSMRSVSLSSRSSTVDRRRSAIGMGPAAAMAARLTSQTLGSQPSPMFARLCWTATVSGSPAGEDPLTAGGGVA